jgi:NADH:ubiquinone oxidoreductase subunit F (NADH-binding)
MSVAAEPRLDVSTATFPGIEPRLLRVGDREDLQAYLRAGGYRPTNNPDALLAAVGEAGLRGRGGAAFPLARKILAVRQGFAAPVVVANGEEGEPASVKDRWLLRHRPHLVLDGVRLAAAMAGAQEAYVYVSDPAAARSVEQALEEFSGQGWAELQVRVHQVRPSYVAGEETAAVRSINGGPALPQDKPPRPFEQGVHDRPTLVGNVETLANLPVVRSLGAGTYRAAGTEDSPGTFLLTLTGGRGRPGLYEVPFGVRLRDVLEWLGEDPASVRGVLAGGYFAGLLTERGLDLPLEYGSFRAAGSGLGCGAMALIGPGVCPVSVAAEVMTYFAANNAGQCGSCFNGTAAMAAVVGALRQHRAGSTDVERLRTWSIGLRGRGACGTLDGATNVAATLLREFGGLVHEHVDAACPSCAGRPEPPGPPFAVIGRGDQK